MTLVESSASSRAGMVVSTIFVVSGRRWRLRPLGHNVPWRLAQSGVEGYAIELGRNACRGVCIHRIQELLVRQILTSAEILYLG
ncbi:MAG: hypothetical protein AAB214_08240 [Fibrobacterota bacterium]